MIHGLGIGSLPDYLTGDFPDLVNILPEEQSAPIPIYLAYVEELRHSKRVCAFRDFILEEITAFRSEGEHARRRAGHEPCGGAIAAMHNIWACATCLIGPRPAILQLEVGHAPRACPLQPPCWTWAELTLGLFFSASRLRAGAAFRRFRSAGDRP